MAREIGLCLIGAGRIGRIHAATLAAHPGAELCYVVDVDTAAAEALSARHGADTATAEAALADPAVDAVVIASSSDSHAPLIEAAARAGKAVFTEKPIDLSLARVERCLEVVAEAGIPLQVGFNRRFDPSFAALHRELSAGRIGKLETVIVTSRDPAPPPLAYLETSGGLFRDMTIHDFDMVRWLVGAEPVELYATSSCLVEPAIGASGDADSAAVTLRSAEGAICLISNSRRAVYGYDQRIEVLGAGGRLRVENLRPTALEVSDAQAVHRDGPLPFFIERYGESYRLELDHFISCLTEGLPPAVTGRDGWAALYLAEAAIESCRSGRPVRLDGLQRVGP